MLSFMNESRRLDNGRMKRELRLRLRYPTVDAGIADAQEKHMMLWVKSFHIFFVVSWFAGLFYLPRIFVNLAMVPADSPPSASACCSWPRKLYKFVTPIGVLAVIFGLWLWFGYGFAGGWLHVKTALVVGLLGYHFYCGKLLPRFPRRQRAALACLVPLLQRGAGAVLLTAGHLHSGGGEAVLSATSRTSFRPCPRGLEPCWLTTSWRPAARDIKHGPGWRRIRRRLASLLSAESGIAHCHARAVASWRGRLRQGRRHLSTGAAHMTGRGLFDVDQTIRIYVTAQRSPLKSLEFITLRVKDAVCDRFRDATGARPSVNTKSPDVRIHLFLTDTAGDALPRYVGRTALAARPQDRQGRRAAQGKPGRRHPAPGRLAAGHALLDPMCGSGTFLLEAAQIAWTTRRVSAASPASSVSNA